MLDVVRSQRLFRYYGPDPSRESVVGRLEKAFAAKMGVPYAQAVNSGTSALTTSLMAIGIKPGDEVIVPAYCWIATANAVILLGGTPVIADLDESLTLDPAVVRRLITPKTRAIIVVHMRGNCADMDPIMAIAREHDLKVIEDTAQACGATYKGRYCGTIGDVGAISLQINKVITSGEGGMVLAKDPLMFDRARTWHDGARIWEITEEDSRAIFAGENYRMPELSGAVGLVQLGKLDMIVSRLRAAKRRIVDGTAHLGLHRRALPDPEGEAALCYMFFAPTAAKAQEVANALKAENIAAFVPYSPQRVDLHVAAHWGRIFKVHTKPFSLDSMARGLDLLSRAVHLDISPLFTEEDINGVVAGLEKVVRALM